MPYSVVGARSIPYPKAGIKLTPETYADFLRNTVHVQGRSAAQQDPHSMLSKHRQRVLGDTQPTRDRTRSRMPPCHEASDPIPFQRGHAGANEIHPYR